MKRLIRRRTVPRLFELLLGLHGTERFMTLAPDTRNDLEMMCVHLERQEKVLFGVRGPAGPVGGSRLDIDVRRHTLEDANILALGEQQCGLVSLEAVAFDDAMSHGNELIDHFAASAATLDITGSHAPRGEGALLMAIQVDSVFRHLY